MECRRPSADPVRDVRAGRVTSGVARHHGLMRQQLFTWRREASQTAAATPVFIPAVI
ncbi:transposase [Methylorubrum extorquens]|uniref:transposase n=1 Tax=Methylorubrum extorquens TaxID=408 RepID=UPI0011BF121D